MNPILLLAQVTVPIQTRAGAAALSLYRAAGDIDKSLQRLRS